MPRVDMAAAALDAPPEEIIRLCVEGGYSRIPVYEGTIDNVVGVLYAKDLLARLAAGKPHRARGAQTGRAFCLPQQAHQRAAGGVPPGKTAHGPL